MKDKSILIVDDERRLADSLRDLLAIEGYKARTAYSGSEALEALREHPYPIVVTDLRMQGVDGLDVIRHVHENYPKTLVIVVTGYASADSAIEALHYHAFDYIRKPFEFDHFKRALERAFQKLEMDQLREDTAAMITHDIKLPLTSIIGYAALLYDKASGNFHPRATDYLDTIQSNGQKVLALIDNYLTSFRAESGNLAVHPREVSIHEFTRGLLEIYGDEAKRKGFAVEADSPDIPLRATFDESLMFRAAGNLLQNAIKYGENSEPIRLIIKSMPAADSPLGKESLRIAVINRAPGLHPGELDGLFERFTRAAFSSGIEGSGIGLYVVDMVARAHGGIANAECIEGERAKFSIIIPLLPNSQSATA